MATYTREQISRWSAKLQNGFKLDTRALVFHGEKNATKYLTLKDGVYLQATLWWTEVQDGHHYTGLVKPQLHLAVWRDGNTSGVMMSSGLGAYLDITEQTYTRRNWNEIIKLTADWTDEKIMEAAWKNISNLEKETVI